MSQLFVINLQPQMQLLKPYSSSLIKNANIKLNNKILVLNQYTITNVELIVTINRWNNRNLRMQIFLPNTFLPL